MLWFARYGLRGLGCGLQVSGCRLCDRRNRSLKPLLAVCFIFLFNSLFAQEFFTNLEDSLFSKQWINLRLVDSVEGYSGSHYSIADPGFQFGLGLESCFPETVQGKNVKMLVEGWIKSNVASDRALFVITLQNESATVFWKAINLQELLTRSNTWANFSEQIKVPASFTKTGIIKAYLWNDDNKDTIAIDDLRFSFEILANPTFIPKIYTPPDKVVFSTDRVLMENSFYKIRYDENKGKISFASASGKVLVHELIYFEETDLHQKTISNFTLKSTKNKKSGKVLKFTVSSAGSDLEVELICLTDSPEIEFNITEKFAQNREISREALVFTSSVGTSKVFRANRKMDTSDFQQEYWLDQQGVQFGNGKNSWLIYHTPFVSSLQLSTKRNQLWVNLDYEKDHPFLHFPLLETQRDSITDISTSLFKKGEKQATSFLITVGYAPEKLPRFMKNPSGFLATYIWTEHADFTDIRTNRATYFGSENITLPDSAIGGFVKYSIPVTKSVFYFNPDSISNKEISGGKFTDLESTILDDRVFEGFLAQLSKNGHEICLHSPEQFTSTNKAMKKSLKYMKKNYSSPTWIDHGYNNGIENNREDLVCDGTLEGAELYSEKIWKKHKLNYFWNPYYEDFYTFDEWQFSEMLSKPYNGFGDFFPDPDYWQHPSRTGDLRHWPTKSVLYVERDDLWDFYFSDVVLNDFVNTWSVHFNHCYPAWVDPEKGFWQYDENGTIKARAGFNRTLESMASLRDEGLLNLTTVQDFIDYQLAVEAVDYEALPDGNLKVTNKGKTEINGFSLVVRAQKVLMNNQAPEQKIVDGELIFWFNLGVGESKAIVIAN